MKPFPTLGNRLMDMHSGSWRLALCAMTAGGLLGWCAQAALAAGTADLKELRDYPALEENQAAAAEAGNSLTSQAAPAGATATAEAEPYEENKGVKDFEIHFFVSLPFTALYSYVSVLSVDALVQGAFPPKFYQADLWMVIGAAVGSSAAIALGSMGRVPDQTQYHEGAPPDNGRKSSASEYGEFRLEFVKIQY